MDKLLAFLNKDQKYFIRDYKLIRSRSQLKKLEKGDFVKLINKKNYKYDKGGKVIDSNESFIIIRGEGKRLIYLEHFYILYKRAMKSERSKIEYLLEGLKNKTIRIFKKK